MPSLVKEFAFVLTVFIVIDCHVECQLIFSADQTVHNLDLHCYVSGGLKSFNFVHVGKLVISHDTSNTSQNLASVSVHESQVGPRSNLTDANVTGNISFDASSRRFLRILWSDVSDSQSGNYTCTSYDVNNEFISSEQITFIFKNMGAVFTATPEIIQIGLTKRLDISCSLPEPEHLNVSTVGSLEVLKVQNGLECVLARIKYSSNAISQSGLEGLVVSGSLDHHRSYITLTWRNPTSDPAGEYVCYGSGIGMKAEPIFFSARLNLTWETPHEDVLIQQLQNLTKRLHELKERQQESEQKLEEVVMTLEHTPNSECRNPTSCDDIYFSLEPGQHIVRVEPEDGLGPLNVLCDVKGKREIYTVFQKRFSGDVDFFRNFQDYENGFGSLEGEFWLGLKNMRRLLLQNKNNSLLSVEMTVRDTKINYTRIYPHFSIGPGDDYLLSVSGLYDRGYGMSPSSLKQFSTYDRGLTHAAGRNGRRAGWWFPEDLGYVNLNGVWGVAGKPYSVFWWEISQNLNSILNKTEMKFKRND